MVIWIYGKGSAALAHCIYKRFGALRAFLLSDEKAKHEKIRATASEIARRDLIPVIATTGSPCLKHRKLLPNLIVATGNDEPARAADITVGDLPLYMAANMVMEAIK